jgi:hypothetical protein
MYDVAPYIPARPNRNLVGMVGGLGFSPSQADLTVFMERYLMGAVTASFSVTHVNPGMVNMQSRPDVNIQYLEAIVFPTPVVYSRLAHTVYASASPFPYTQDFMVPSAPHSLRSWLRHKHSKV